MHNAPATELPAGGPDAAGFRAAVIAYVRAQARPVDKFSHQPRLYELVREVAAGLGADDDILFAAVWLHDLGVFVGHRPEEPAALAAWDNVAYACAQAPALLAEFGFPAAKIPAVVEAMRTHTTAGEPTTLEGVILRDADLLEQLGAAGLLRAISKVGRDTRFHTFTEALRSLQRAADTLPAQMRLPRTRELAAPRLALLRAFLDQARAEGGAVPW